MPKISFYLAGSADELTFTISQTSPTVQMLTDALPISRWGTQYHLRLRVPHSQFKYVWRDLNDPNEVLDTTSSSKRIVLQALPLNSLSNYDDHIDPTKLDSDLVPVNETNALNSLSDLLLPTSRNVPTRSPSSSPPPPPSAVATSNEDSRLTNTTRSAKSTKSKKDSSSTHHHPSEGVTPLKNLFSGAFAAIKKNLEGDF
jgi:hypothetical protein